MTFLESILLFVLLAEKVKGLVMAKIGTPLSIPELNLMPTPQEAIELSADMQQALATICGFWQNKRILLKASPSGVLSVASARLAGIKHFTASGANDAQTGADIPCTECLCMCHPDNDAKVWVCADEIATTSNAWPLGAGEVIGFTLENMRQLNMLIVGDTEKLIVAYTR